MSIEVLKDAKLYMAGRDFTGVMNALALDYSAETKAARVFGDAAVRRISGLTDISLSHAGFFDADTVDKDLHANIGVDNVPMTAAPNDGAEGKTAFIFRAAHSEYSPGGEMGELFRYAVTALGSSGESLVKGTILHNGVQTVSGNGTAFQVGAVGAAQKLYAALHVLTVAGSTPTLDVTVESDDLEGFGTTMTQITFGQKTAVGAEWATPVAGVIADDWWRIAFTIGGGSPSFAFIVTIGIL